MSMGRRRRPWLALLAALALTASGCAEPDPPSPSPTASATASAATPAPTNATPPPFAPLAHPPDGEAPCGQPGYAGSIRRIAAVDARTVSFELCAPDAAFLARIASPVVGIHRAADLEAGRSDGSRLERPNGTGPYRVKDWIRGERLVLERHDDYWAGPAPSVLLEFRWDPDADRRVGELQAGNVDGVDAPGAEAVAAFRLDPNVRVVERPGLHLSYLGMNATIAPWNDLRVREAIAMGIDRQTLVSWLYPPGSREASHLVPCTIPDGCEGEPWHEFDLPAARQLLADAGYPEGFVSKLQFHVVDNDELPDVLPIVTEIQEQLAANLGIEVSLDLLSRTEFTDGMAAGTLDGLFLVDWIADLPDASHVLGAHLGAAAGARFGAPLDRLAALLDQAAATVSAERRAAAYEAVNELLRVNVPLALLAHAGSGAVFQADVSRPHASPVGAERFDQMRAGDRSVLVWLQEAEPGSLYCADEVDAGSFRACSQVVESLFAYETGGSAPVPALATACEPDTTLMTWTCTLRQGVRFHDGTALDANDVVTSYAAVWDARHPFRAGRTGEFERFARLFGGFLDR